MSLFYSVRKEMTNSCPCILESLKLYPVENKKRESKQREEGENAERRGKETERRGREGRD